MPISFSSPFRMFGMVGLFTLTTGIAYGQSQDLTIHGQVRALSSTDAIVRESAVRQLIGRGVGITASMQRLATSSDPMIRIGAIRVLSGLDAVTPSIEQDVLAILGRLASQEISVDQARGLIFDLGPTAVRHSRQLFEDEAGLSGTAASLYVHIVVRQGLESLTRCDSGASTRADEILSLGGHAIPALFSTLHSMSSSLELRLHSLWLISLVSGSDAVPLLLPLLRDPEPDIQRQVLSLISSRLSEEHIDLLLQYLPDGSGLIREFVCDSASVCFSTQALEAWANGDEPRRSQWALDVLELKKECGSDLESLARDDDESALKELEERFFRETHPDKRAALLRWISMRPDAADSLVVLCAGLFDSSPSVRLMAADALVRVRAIPSAKALLLALNDTDTAVRARASSALAEMAGLLPLNRAIEDGYEVWRRSESTESRAWRSVALRGKSLVGSIHDAILSDHLPRLGRPRPTSEVLIHAIRTDGASRLHELLGHVSTRQARVLYRLMRESEVDEVGVLFERILAMPMSLSIEGLVALTQSMAHCMMRGVGDRYSHVDFSHDPSGRPNPSWAPGLMYEQVDDLGISIESLSGEFSIRFTSQGSVAERSGLRRGDRVLAVNGEAATGQSREWLQDRLRANAIVEVRRDDSRESNMISLVESDGAIEWMASRRIEGDLGYIRIGSFDAGASKRFERLLLALEGQPLRGLIIDVRNNPGGSVFECARVMDFFIDGTHPLVNLRDNTGTIMTVNSSESAKPRDYPLCILVDQSSASAAEILAGGLQHLKRATVMGGATFGKGVAQSVREFPGFPFEGALGTQWSKVTLTQTELSYDFAEAPSPDGIGISPDIWIHPSFRGPGDIVIEAAHSLLRERSNRIVGKDSSTHRIHSR